MKSRIIYFLSSMLFLLLLWAIVPFTSIKQQVAPSQVPTDQVTPVVPPTQVTATQAFQADESSNLPIAWVLGSFLTIFIFVFGIIFKGIDDLNKRVQENNAKSIKAEIDSANAVVMVNKLSQNFTDVEEDIAELRRIVSNLGSTSLDENIAFLDEGKIDTEEFIEKQQQYSWQKWITQKTDIGWYELLAHASQDGGLKPRLRLIIQSELERLQEKEISRGKLTIKEDEYLRRLRELLSIKKR